MVVSADCTTYMYIHSSEKYTYHPTNTALKVSAANLSTKFYNKVNHKNTKNTKNNSLVITKIPRKRLYIHFRFIIKIEIMTTKNTGTGNQFAVISLQSVPK